MRLLRRMPAVSTKRIGPSSVSTTVSTLSRVVPGTSWTTERSSPMRRLNSVDLPTVGRPTMATAGTAGLTGCGGGGGRDAGLAGLRRLGVPVLVVGCGQPFDHGVEQVTGTAAVKSADRERVAEPQ